MSEIRGNRSSKRKGRDGSDDAAPRKKQHRPAATTLDDDSQSEDYGSASEKITSRSTSKAKGKSAPRNEKEYPSINELKKRIRDVKRLLNKGTLPADARIVQERALAGYEQDLMDEIARRERSSMIKKYHFVRFLDRKTASKQLSRLERHEKDQDLDPKQKANLVRKIHAARVDYNYTIYYPLTEKYISLYPKSKDEASNEADAISGSESDSKEQKKTTDSKPAIWSVVEKCMKEGTLDLLREGKLNIGPDGKQTQSSSDNAATDSLPAEKMSKKEGMTKKTVTFSGKDRRAPREDKRADQPVKPARKDHKQGRQKTYEAPAPDDGNESDGGFFEF
ncbi:rRNA-processing protein efg1 [Penicillium macrosclerotiorum]|uniref:rRNA-processing protein efg1 n=1 Tax=Penicillium macrosclerotiorum TaxID=303699 RepID=UPI002547C106|nr:rRNA-processing protein efg1 [Penicillium macrosclerotiorum]KAJ5676255.1 rRNA-processing protein efg1 [Penicillium macrosclerotiorum]